MCGFSIDIYIAAFDKAAKSMRKEDEPMSNCKSNRFNQSERRCRQNHHGGQFGRKSGTVGQKSPAH